MKIRQSDRKRLDGLQFDFDLTICLDKKIVTRSSGSQMSYSDVLSLLRAHKNGFEKRLVQISTLLKNQTVEPKKKYKTEQLSIDPNYKL